MNQISYCINNNVPQGLKGLKHSSQDPLISSVILFNYNEYPTNEVKQIIQTKDEIITKKDEIIQSKDEIIKYLNDKNHKIYLINKKLIESNKMLFSIGMKTHNLAKEGYKL
jgi:hypothetical protein